MRGVPDHLLRRAAKDQRAAAAPRRPTADGRGRVRQRAERRSIANAIYDATGVRFREVPFTPERFKAGLDAAEAKPGKPRSGWLYGLLGSGAAAAAGFAAALSWQGAIAPVSRPDPASFPAELIERGRQLAAVGACAVCHTETGGQPYAGGHRLETPFGAIYTTNITPDPETGIGTWSYAAFERAMRHGVHRDGRRLYPAFPYTSYASITYGDMQALYAYLMSLDPVPQKAPENELGFPFNQRVLMAGWNALYHRPVQYKTDATRSTEWNRGAYLVDGLGHCSACHSPRNALGAERKGAAHLAGGMVEGWEAPALTALSKAPVPWTEDALFAYLRDGHSSQHGVAAGPMGPVVRELAEVPDSDIRAMAIYLASLNGDVSSRSAAAAVVRAEQAALFNREQGLTVGARMFEGACASCHKPAATSHIFGLNPSLALSTNIHSERPDNLIRIILDGVANPVHANHGAIPSFRNVMDDAQVATLVSYLRSSFAPDKPSWQDLPGTITRIRKDLHRIVRAGRSGAFGN